jgi:hypothetical protein
VAKVTPTLKNDLGYKLFMMFATINIGGMAVFSLSVTSFVDWLVGAYDSSNSLLPETKGRSLEEMDIIFGSVSVESRDAFIVRALDHSDMKPEQCVDHEV